MRAIPILAVLMASRVAGADSKPWDGKTIALQSGASAGALVVGGAVGGGAALVCKEGTCGAGMIIAGATAAAVVAPWLVGKAMDGTGTFKGTAVGGGIGVGVSLAGVVLLVTLYKDKAPPVAAMVSLALPVIAGSVIGYHVSAKDEPGTTLRVPLASFAF
jgi:hypothetical protein